MRCVLAIHYLPDKKASTGTTLENIFFHVSKLSKLMGHLENVQDLPFIKVPRMNQKSTHAFSMTSQFQLLCAICLRASTKVIPASLFKHYTDN